MAGIHDVKRTRKDLDVSSRKKHQSAVNDVMDCIGQMVNPFTSEHTELVNISSGVVASSSCSEALMSARAVGEAATEKFMEQRLHSAEVPFHAPMKKLKLETFSTKVKTNKKGKGTVQTENSRALFTRLLLVGKSESVDLRQVLTHSLGNVSFPLASADGQLAKTTKAKMAHLILKKWDDGQVPEILPGGALVIDGMALVQSVSAAVLPHTFGQLADLLLGIILARGRKHKCARVDVVFDTYPSVSIKSLEHKRRAASVGAAQQRMIYGPEQTLPKQWKNFLTSGTNKETLIEYFVTAWSSVSPSTLGDMLVFIAHGTQCHRVQVVDATTTSTIIPRLESDHEEADTRLILHAVDAGRSHDTVIIHSPDTDVLVLSVCHAHSVPSDNLILISGDRLIDIKKVSEKMGRVMCLALLGLHILTGCDTTSAFHGKGKLRAFELICSNNKFRDAMADLGSTFRCSDETMRILEEFVCSLYAVKGTSVNEVRYKLFCSKSLSEQRLPPTEDALSLHVARACYQSAIHRRATQQFIEAPSPDGHGWVIDDGELRIKWMSKTPAPPELMARVHCGCKKSACQTKVCSCRSSGVSCTDLCGCSNCNNEEPTNPERELLMDDSESDESDDDA